MRRIPLAIVIAGICLVAAGPAGATFPGANGRIAYETAPPGNLYRIHTVLPNGQADVALGPGDLPSWSPDGRHITFTRAVNGQADIYSMTADGGNVRRLTHSVLNEGRPSYSPNGNRIVFTRIRNAGSWVMTMRSDGSNQQRLVGGGPAVWSPTGRWIAFDRNSDRGLWVAHPNGTGKHRILKRGGYIGGYSPDGRKITFSRCGDRCRYFVGKSDGSKVRRLPCRSNFFRGVTAPTYSPDGRRLLGGTARSGRVDVVKLPLHSCSPKVVASGVTGTLPDWQPLPDP